MFRWLLRVLAVLVVIVIIAIVAIYAASAARMNHKYDIPQQSLALSIPTDSSSIERGRHLAVAIAKCTDCHGANLGGTIFLDIPPAKLIAPNLTRGQGGIGTTFTDADFVRAIRHGVGPDGRGLFVMPSDDFQYLSDADLADIIAYVKSRPPVDHQLPNKELHLLGRALMIAGLLPGPVAEKVDHSMRQPATETPAATVDYGRYMALTGGCTGCHGAGLSGGAIPGLPPDAPKAQNITSAGIGSWSDADFYHALRTGKRPDGTTMNALMPWRYTAQMTDQELKALLLYLRSVPSRPSGTR